MGKKINKFVAGTLALGTIAGTSIFLESKYDLTGRVESLFGETKQEIINYVKPSPDSYLVGLDQDKMLYLAQKSYDGLENRADFIGRNAGNLSQKEQIGIVGMMSDSFTPQTYETLVPELFHKSGEKYSNHSTLVLRLFKKPGDRIKEILGNGLEKSKEIYNGVKEKVAK